jgi:hypothetical protein
MYSYFIDICWVFQSQDIMLSKFRLYGILQASLVTLTMTAQGHSYVTYAVCYEIQYAPESIMSYVKQRMTYCLLLLFIRYFK